MQAATLRCPPHLAKDRYTLEDFEVTRNYAQGPVWRVCAAVAKWCDEEVLLQCYTEAASVSGQMGLALAAVHQLQHPGMLELWAVFRDAPSSTVIMMYPGKGLLPLDLGPSLAPPAPGMQHATGSSSHSERAVVRGCVCPLASALQELQTTGLRMPYVCGLDVWVMAPPAAAARPSATGEGGDAADDDGPRKSIASAAGGEGGGGSKERALMRLMVPLMCTRQEQQLDGGGPGPGPSSGPVLPLAATHFAAPALQRVAFAAAHGGAGHGPGRPLHMLLPADALDKCLSYSLAAVAYTALFGEAPHPAPSASSSSAAASRRTSRASGTGGSAVTTMLLPRYGPAPHLPPSFGPPSPPGHSHSHTHTHSPQGQGQGHAPTAARPQGSHTGPQQARSGASGSGSGSGSGGLMVALGLQRPAAAPGVGAALGAGGGGGGGGSSGGSSRGGGGHGGVAGSLPLWLSEEASDFFRKGLALDDGGRPGLDALQRLQWVVRHAVPQPHEQSPDNALGLSSRELHRLLLDVMPMAVSAPPKDQVAGMLRDMAVASADAPGAAPRPVMPWEAAHGPAPRPAGGAATAPGEAADEEQQMLQLMLQRATEAEEATKKGRPAVSEEGETAGASGVPTELGDMVGGLGRLVMALQAATRVAAAKASGSTWQLAGARGATFDELAKQKAKKGRAQRASGTNTATGAGAGTVAAKTGSTAEQQVLLAANRSPNRRRTHQGSPSRQAPGK